MSDIEVTREVLLRDESAKRDWIAPALGVLVGGVAVGLSLLPRTIQKPIEDAMRESLVSGFSTVLLLTVILAIAWAGLTSLFNRILAARHRSPKRTVGLILTDYQCPSP